MSDTNADDDLRTLVVNAAREAMAEASPPPPPVEPIGRPSRHFKKVMQHIKDAADPYGRIVVGEQNFRRQPLAGRIRHDKE